MGSLLSFFLHGIYAMQLYHYYMTYASTDRRCFVYLIGVVTVIELLHMSFSTHSTYSILAVGFGNPASIVDSPISASAIATLNGAAGFCTQVFFAWRIMALTKNLWGRAAALLIALTAALQLVASFAASAFTGSLLSQPHLLRSLNRTVTVWLAGSLSCDVLITATMVIVLLLTRERTSHRRSKNILNTLIYHTVENGMITTVCALAELICWLVYPNTFLHIAFGYIIGRLYAIVLLATLNGRQRIREAAASDHGVSFKSTGKDSGSTTNQVQLGVFRSDATAINASSKSQQGVSITTEMHVDDDNGMRKSQDYPLV